MGYTTYRPSLIEMLSGAGIISFGLLAFTLAVRYLKVVDHGSANLSDRVDQPKEIEEVPIPSGD